MTIYKIRVLAKTLYTTSSITIFLIKLDAISLLPLEKFNTFSYIVHLSISTTFNQAPTINKYFLLLISYTQIAGGLVKFDEKFNVLVTILLFTLNNLL